MKLSFRTFPVVQASRHDDEDDEDDFTEPKSGVFLKAHADVGTRDDVQAEDADWHGVFESLRHITCG